MPAKTSPILEDQVATCEGSRLLVCLSVVNLGEARKLTAVDRVYGYGRVADGP